MKTKTLNLLGAYGRRYSTREQALVDWAEGKDFQIAQGPYLSVRDVKTLKAEGYTTLDFFAHTTGKCILIVEIK